MGNMGGYPGAVAGSPSASWGQSPSGYPGAGLGSLPGLWGQSMPNTPLPTGAQDGFPPPYPYMGPQPSMTATMPASATVPNNTSIAAALSMPPETAPLLANGTAPSGLLPSARQASKALEANAEGSHAGQAVKQMSSSMSAEGSARSERPVGIATCLPNLHKQLSIRSNEDLTAKAVAKLWGVNLKRYTGRTS